MRIEYAHSALNDIREAAVDGVRRFRHGGIEVGGILFGSFEDGKLLIEGAKAVPCEYAYGPSFVLSERDRDAFDRILREGMPGLKPAGFYQSHTRAGIALSGRELDFLRQHFPEPWQVALIVKPEPFGTASGGTFLRDENGAVRPDFVPVEFPTNMPSRAVGQAFSPAEPLSEGSNRPEARFAANNDRPTKPHLHLPRASAALMALVLLVAAVAFWQFRQRRPLSLRAWDSGGQLRIEWDRSARAVRNGTSAVLEIDDGGQRVALPFDARHLQQGSVTYVRRSGSVDVRLRIFVPGGEPVEVSTRFLGKPARPETGPALALKQPDPGAPSEEKRSVPPSIAPEPERTPEAKSDPEPKPETQPKRTLALAQLRLPPSPPARSSDAQIPAPPPLNAPVGVAAAPMPVQQRAPAPPAPKPPPATNAEPAKPAYRGPRSGRVIWTGLLPKGVALTIDGRRASTGFVTGELPGVPVRIEVSPAELSSKGLRVYTRAAARDGVEEAPGSANGWNRTTYDWNPRRASEVALLETPAAANHWKGLALRSDSRQFAILVIEWRVIE